MSDAAVHIPAHYEQRLLRVIDHIYRHLDGDLSLDALAGVAAMSRFHWHRVYHGLTGETIAETIRRARLGRAANELVQSGDSILSVALRCGYPNRRSFERAFRDSHGMTPAKFQKLGQAVPYPALRRRTTVVNIPVQVREFEPRRIAALLHQGAFDTLAGTLHKVFVLMGTRGIVATGPPLAVFLTSDAIPEAERRAWIGIPVAPETAVEALLQRVTVAGGRYAMGAFKGHYAGLPEAWGWFCGPWLAAHGGELRDVPTFEVYRDDPALITPTEIVTEMYLPIA